jgi:preprotein translocase subunit SecD
LRRRRSLFTVVAVFVVVAAAASYFLGINPILNHITQGLDLQGGLYVVFQAEPTATSPVTPAVMQDVVKVMNFRVNALGVAEPQIQQAGTNQVIVQLPGVKNADQALQTIGQTGLLEFRKSDGKTVITTGADLVSAQAQIGPNNAPQVALQFNAAGAKAIAAYTAANIGKTMPIYLDNNLVESPTVQGAIPNGQGVITNMGSLQQAQALAVELNSGSLPVGLKVVEDETVGPTLGADSVARSKTAAAIAILFIAAFMLTLYRIPGFWAVFALAVYAMILLGILVAINATLTLPGITGLILSVGVAVDSNVIIFERIKEELRAGRTLRAAIEEGFRNGLRAVYDSNATTIIAAAVLFWLGTGPIRGFAVTVGIGVVISLITAVTFTKFILGKVVDAGAQPSAWFFARRGDLATAAAAAGAASGAAAAAAGAAASDPLASASGAPATGRRRATPSRSGFSFRSVDAGGGAEPVGPGAGVGTGGPGRPAEQRAARDAEAAEIDGEDVAAADGQALAVGAAAPGPGGGTPPGGGASGPSASRGGGQAGGGGQRKGQRSGGAGGKARGKKGGGSAKRRSHPGGRA